MKRCAALLLCLSLFGLFACSPGEGGASLDTDVAQVVRITAEAPEEPEAPAPLWEGASAPAGERVEVSVRQYRDGWALRSYSKFALTLPEGWTADKTRLYDESGVLRGTLESCVLLGEEERAKDLLAPEKGMHTFWGFLELDGYARADGLPVYYAVCENTYEREEPNYLYRYVVQPDEERALLVSFTAEDYDAEAGHGVFCGIVETIQAV